MLRSQQALARDSPERLRILEVAEVSTQLHFRALMLEEFLLTVNYKQSVINVIQCTRDANVSALQAEMHAREAELHANRAALELGRIQQLCAEDPFDSQTRKIINGLIKNAGLAALEDKLRKAADAEIEEARCGQVASTAKVCSSPSHIITRIDSSQDGCLQSES
jgi:hypothetical protein